MTVVMTSGEEKQEKLRASWRKASIKYKSTAKGVATQSRYAKTPKAKECKLRYSKTDEGIIVRRMSVYRSILRYPEKHRAHSAVNHALKTGTLIRPKVCDENNKDCKGTIQAHHPDYSKKLEVVWLCKYHHTIKHPLGEGKL